MKRLAVCVALLILLTVDVPAQTGDINDLELAFLARLEQLIDSQRRAIEVPGATAAFVTSDDRVIGVATGLANKELGLEMKPETRMFAGSTGKTYAAALLMWMVSQGKLSLDDKLSRYLGDEQWYAQLPNAEDITIRQLLNHGSGIDRYVNTDVFPKLVMERVTNDPRYWTPPRDLVALILGDQPLFPAGEGYNYADTNFLLAGMVVEKVGGFRLEHEIVRRLLYPHGLVQTGPQDGIWHAGLAQGYFPPEFPLAQFFKTALDRGLFRWNPLGEWTGGGFISNSMELARWAKILYEGKAFDAPYLDEMVGSVNPYSRSAGYGYGLGVVVEDHPEHGQILRHAGIYFGYGTSMAYYADHQVAIAVQVNTMNSDVAKAIRIGLAEVVLKACQEQREQQTVCSR